MRRRKGARPCVIEGLEDRTLLTAFVVNTTSDDADDAAGVADGDISLREAIMAANTNAAFGDAPAGMATGDTITFDPAVFTGPEAARTINLQNGRLTITDDLRIVGVAPDVIIDAGGGSRIFRIVTNQVVSMSDLTLRDAASTDGAGGGAMRLEGGGRTFLNRVTIEGSSAVGRGGAMLVLNSTLETFDSVIQSNDAAVGGGLANILGVVTLNHTLVDDNFATGEGGGLSNDAGRLILRESVVSNNTSDVAAGLRGGGGVHNINNGRLAISSSDVVNNEATYAHGGGIFTGSGTVTIGGSTISGNTTPLTGGGLMSVNGSVTIDDSTISRNTVGRAGGGVEVVAGQALIRGTLFGGPGFGAGNVAGGEGLPPANGGGLHVSGPALVILQDATVQNNVATGEGGGLWNSAKGTLVVRGGTPTALTGVTEGISFDPLTLQLTVDQFRAGLGVDNGGVVGSQGSGRREINWDDVPDFYAAPNAFLPDLFNIPFDPYARGVEVSTPGTGFQVSASSLTTESVRFGNINPSYVQNFHTFSDERLLSPIDSNVTVVNFFVPGTDTPAVVDAFGAVFTDVDVFGPTKMEFLDADGNVLLERAALAQNGEGVLSFLGATFTVPVIAQVRITTGTGPLGPNDVTQSGPTDVVALDDFIYGEPVSQADFVTDTLIINNQAQGDDADQGGGGIFNDGGRLAITGVTLDGNVADGEQGSGGGIFSRNGLVTIEDSIISNNHAARAGGGIEVVWGRVELTNVTLGGSDVADGNTTGMLPFTNPAPGNGGGLHMTGNVFVQMTGGSVQNNEAANEGGGLWNSATGVMVIQDDVRILDNAAHGDLADDGGGGIFNNGGRLVVTDSTVSNNQADGISGSGGGLQSLGGVVTLTNSLFESNAANRAGGGVEMSGGRLELRDVTLLNNSAGSGALGTPGNGGGLHVTGASRVDIFGGLVEGNHAANEGGGLWNSGTGVMVLHGGTALRNNVAVGNDNRDGGGAIFNDGGRLSIVATEISGNGATGLDSTGGGLLTLGGLTTITNSTISGNTAESGGGGIANFGALVISTNNTIVLNLSNADGTGLDGGGIYTAFGASTGLRNTIVAGNRSQTMTPQFPIDSDLGGGGSYGTSAFNLIGSADSAGGLINGENGNIVGLNGVGTIDIADIVDTTLQNNGGPTSTHLLTLGSLARNAGSNALAIDGAGKPLQFDQRGPGFPRFINFAVDIGAVEL